MGLFTVHNQGVHIFSKHKSNIYTFVQLCIHVCTFVIHVCTFAKIGQLDSGKMEIRKPTLPALTSTSDLADFVGERSSLLFDLLEIPVTFLQLKEWSLQLEYNAVQSSLGNLSAFTT